jgi:hypothetical protein
MWRNLFFSIAEGDILKIHAIHGMSIFEFWPFFDQWKEKIAKQNENIKNKKHVR